MCKSNRSLRNYLLLLVILITSQSLFSQRQKTTPPTTQTELIDTSADMPIREKLVQLAIQNPDLEIADRRISIAEYQLKRTKTKALENIYISGNLNEFSVKGSDIPNQFFPRYNIGATLPLDLFFTRSNDIKIAKENVGIQQAEKNARYRQIRSLVLTAYEDYLMNKQMLEFQSQISQDSYTVFVKSEKDFNEGIISQEEYNKSFKAHSEEQSRKISLQRNFNVSKIELERMIGIPIEEVLEKYK